MTSFREVYERIQIATKASTQTEIAEMLGIAQSSISDAKSRDSVPSKWYVRLFQRFGVNPDWLESGTGPMFLKTKQGVYEPYDDLPPEGLHIKTSQLSEMKTKGAVVTVHSMQCENPEHDGWNPIPIEKLMVPLHYAPVSIFVIRMDSSSMAPLIKRGAYVGIDTSQKSVVSGELFCLYIPMEGLALKRIYIGSPEDKFILRSESDSHPDQYVTPEQYTKRILGRAAWLIQEF